MSKYNLRPKRKVVKAEYNDIKVQTDDDFLRNEEFEEEEQTEYSVKKIHQHREVNGEIYFLTEWLSFEDPKDYMGAIPPFPKIK